MRHQDLNLLAVFDAIMTEGSITRAADRLALTQPAVSNSLSRMRALWGDELFVKDGRNIRPTVFAQNLWSQIKEPLLNLEKAVDQGSFDPATAERTFKIASADAMVEIVWPELRQILEKEAPGINVHAIPYTITNAENLLNTADVDMVIGANVAPSSVIQSEYLYTPWFVLVMRQDHPLAKADVSLDEFARADHLIVSLSGDISGNTDQVLSQHGLKRRVAMSVNHFSVVTPLLQKSDLIAMMPSTTIERSIFNGDLAVVKPPIEVIAPQLSSYWHKRQEHDAGLRWLRQHISRIVKNHAEEHYTMLQARYCSDGECTENRCSKY